MKKKILIIDDNVPILNSLHMFLELYNYEVETAQDGSCLQSGPKEVPDILLVDYHLPYVENSHIIEQIKNDHRMQNLPILLMSGDTEIEHISLFLNVEDFIAKPLNLDELVQKLDTILLKRTSVSPQNLEQAAISCN